MLKSSGEQSNVPMNFVPTADSSAGWFQALVEGWKDPIACGVVVLLAVLLLIVSSESGPKTRQAPHLSIKPESVQRRG